MSARLPVRPLAIALLLTACVSGDRETALAAPTPVFVPEDFFVGRSHGDGVLDVMMSGKRAVAVDSRGWVDPDGMLVIEQRVVEGSKPPRMRTWRIRSTGRGEYAGTLSDADGPVSGDVDGNRLHLRFAMDGGLDAEQWLYLQPGGTVAINRMVVRKWGVPVASLDETIRRIAAP